MSARDSAAASRPSYRRVNVDFSERHMTALRYIAAVRGKTVSDALRDALATAKWVDDLQCQGVRFIREDANGRRQEVVFL